jgi:serine protease Do
MKEDLAILELLDGYVKGTLSVEEHRLVEQRMQMDVSFKEKVEEHTRLIKAMELHHRRNQIKNMLEEVHQEIESQTEEVMQQPPIKIREGFWKKYWPLTAVAASIVLLSVSGTLWITSGLETKQTAYYKELRRNVDQIKKSQKLIMEGIAETKEKSNAKLAMYAGTGFLMSFNGYVATSYHVVKDADSVYIENQKFGSLKATVYFSDPANDVAVLKIVNETFNPDRLPFTIQSTESELGEYVYTLGFPREDIVFGEGSVSAATGYQQNINAYQVSVPVNPGNSGGPLLNANGDLIGMISGTQTETSGATFAIKSTVFLSLLKEVPADSLSKPIVLPTQSALRKLPRTEQVKKWKELVFIVRVYNNQSSR